MAIGTIYGESRKDFRYGATACNENIRNDQIHIFGF